MEENKKENANIKDNENIISKTTVDNAENITDNISKDGQVKKQKIIPSYEKKNVKNNIVKTKKKKISKIWLIILMIIVITVIMIVIWNNYKISFNKYIEYSNQMKIYGFDSLYNDSKTTEYQKVTKSEALKLVIASTLNVSSIDNLIYAEDLKYDNEVWSIYAIQSGMLEENEINEKNEKDKATLMNCLNYLYKAKTVILGKEADVESNPKYADFEKYSNDEQLVIKDMLWNKIIENKNENLDAYKNISKGELSKLIISFVKKYNTLTYDDLKLTINSEKLPSNYEDFPYCISNVNKKIYEIRYFYNDVSKFKKPVEIYSKYKDQMRVTALRIQKYLTTILNVDYRNITFDNFKIGLDEVTKTKISDDVINQYINYVKTNKIITTGNITIIYPVFYFDGLKYRMRCNVSYKINNSDTMKNILFGDSMNFKNEYSYKNDNNVILDVSLEKYENDKSFYISNGESINDWMIYNLDK